MCSELCPCYPGVNNATRDYWEGLGTDKLLEFGRIKDYDDLSDHQKQQYKEKKIDAEVVPLIWNSINSFTVF